MKKMISRRNFLAASGIAATAAVLTACGNSESSASSAASTSASAASSAASSEATWDEVTEVNFYMCNIAGVTDEGVQNVEDALNAITEKSIGVHVNMTEIAVGDYGTQVNLAITSNDKIDLCMIMPLTNMGVASMAANNQLMALNDLLDEYGQDVQSVMGDYLDAGKVGDTYYEVPCYRLYSSSLTMNMRKDILEELGMVEKAENMTTWAEFEEILAAVAENYDIAPIGGADGAVFVNDVVYMCGDKFSDAVTFDTLGADAFIISTDDEGKVYSLTSTDEFKNAQARVQKWWNNGWIYKDNTTTTYTREELFSNNLIFSACYTDELGAAASKKANTGYDMVIAEITPNSVTTQHVNKFGLAIPVTAEEPEAAMRLINLMYTSSEVMNLLNWGVEGTDYVVTDGEAGYPNGSSEGIAYHNRDFMIGNYFITLPWEGNGYGADFRDVALETLQAAPVSPYLGFNADTKAINNEITQVNNVINEYIKNIRTGSFDDAMYQEFQEKLEAAGIQTVVDEYQSQLDAWLAQK